jgi:hypothetical protein
MTSGRWRLWTIGVAVAAVLLAYGPALSQKHERARDADARRELHRQEVQLKRARRVTRRIVHDRRASAEVKRQAGELEQVLDQRERTLAEIERLHRDFVAQHRTDIDALADLRRQAMEIDRRLREARDNALKTHEAQVQSFVTGSDRAQELVDALNAAYATDKRERRQE